MGLVVRLGSVFLSVICAQAQTALAGREARVVDRLFAQATGENTLDCRAQTFAPFLDFGFRFEAGYTLDCGISQFSGDADRLLAFLRVKPEGGERVTLGESFAIPAIPERVRARMNWRRFHDVGELSGVFATGEGAYQVELLVVDKQMRVYRKAWKMMVQAHGKEREAAITLPPHHAESAMSALASEHDLKPQARAGLRLTVLLNASPLYGGGNKMHAWDRAFLLQSLSSLLGDATYSAVRLVAFNLDQQKEVYRQEHFSRGNFEDLEAALRGLELGTIAYRTLANQAGWAELLARLLNEEAARPAADAVIFLGQHSRIAAKVPAEMLAGEDKPRLFYFEYYPRYGADFPDTLQLLTNAYKGTVIKIHNPAELAEGIQKMQRVLKENGSRAAGQMAPATGDQR